MGKRDRTYVSVTLYQRWKERNNVREGERRRSPAELASFIIQAQSEEFLKISEPAVHANREEVKRWSVKNQRSGSV